MALEITLDGVVETLEHAVSQLPDAFAYGEQLADKIDRIYFVAHGSANRAMQGMAYWIEHYSPTIEVRRYFPSEFITQDPPKLDERTLVFLASKSGTTPETLQAADYLADKPCQVVGFTLRGESPLARKSSKVFLAGETGESFVALFMLMQAVVGGVLKGRDGWSLGDDLLSSLAALPRSIAEAAIGNDPRALADAQEYYRDDKIYHVASGPGFTPAYVFGVCILMEMLWLHSYPHLHWKLPSLLSRAAKRQSGAKQGTLAWVTPLVDLIDLDRLPLGGNSIRPACIWTIPNARGIFQFDDLVELWYGCWHAEAWRPELRKCRIGPEAWGFGK